MDIAPEELEGTSREGQSLTALLLRATAPIEARGCVRVSYGEGGFMHRSWQPAPATRCTADASTRDVKNFIARWRLDLDEIGNFCARRRGGDEDEDERARSELEELSSARMKRVPRARPSTALVAEMTPEAMARGGVPVRHVVRRVAA